MTNVQAVVAELEKFTPAICERGYPACRELYDRLVAKGKNGKLALIAVCNKLLKQAFAIVTSGMPYQADFAKIKAPTLAF